MGLRLESLQYPWLAGGDHSLCVFGAANGEAENDGKYITQDEMADVVRYAFSHGIDVIPSFDSPGHMNYAVKRYNEHFGTDIGNYFHKNGKVSIVQGSSRPKEIAQTSYSRGIDITNPEAVTFAKNLYTEYGKFFRELGCTSFDIGGDELLGFGDTIDESLSKWQNLEHWDAHARKATGNPKAVAYDAFILYMNDIASLMRSLGYESVLMWNDDAYRTHDTDWQEVVSLDKAIEIQYWSTCPWGSKNTAEYYLNRGHRIYNFTNHYCYYTLGFEPNIKVTPEMIENEWSLCVYDEENSDNNLKVLTDEVKGGGMCLWSDSPAEQSEDEVLENIRPYIRAIGKALCASSE
jgi:hexosaminidase